MHVCTSAAVPTIYTLSEAGDDCFYKNKLKIDKVQMYSKTTEA